jgi:hypothetical protein
MGVAVGGHTHVLGPNLARAGGGDGRSGELRFEKRLPAQSMRVSAGILLVLSACWLGSGDVPENRPGTATKAGPPAPAPVLRPQRGVPHAEPPKECRPDPGRVSEDSRRIPWAPRIVLDDHEVVILASPADHDEDSCSLGVSLAFQIENFRLASDGDVVWGWDSPGTSEPHTVLPATTKLQDAQLGRGVILCGVEGQTRYGKPVFNCTLEIRFRTTELLAPPFLIPAPGNHSSETCAVLLA